MADQDEEVTVVEIDALSVYQQDKAMVDVQITTAHAFPRNIMRAVDNAVAIVTMDEATAKTATYSVPRGGKPITGPSVHLAKILAQGWGNMRVQAKVIAIDQKQITSQAVCWDLETNLAIQVEVKRSIVGRNGRFSDDMITVTGNAANSIALRNAVLSVIPRAVVDKVYNAAISKLTGDVSTEAKLVARRKQVVDALKDTYSVKEEEILSAIGKASISHIGPDEIVVLIGIGTAIKDGDTTVDEAFRKKKTDAVPKVTNKQLQDLLEEKKAKVPKDKIGRYIDIIEKDEIESYEKMFKELQAL